MNKPKTKNPLGERIKVLRQKAGILPEDLAPVLDLPNAVLAKIESGVVEPTVATLLKISQYFNVPMETFFSDEILKAPLQVVRAHELEKTERKRASGEVVASYKYWALAPKISNKNMQPFLIELDPNVKEDLPRLSHEGEEFFYVLEGHIELQAGKEVIQLKPGDCVYFQSEIPHAVYGRGKSKSRAVVVVYQKH